MCTRRFRCRCALAVVHPVGEAKCVVERDVVDGLIAVGVTRATGADACRRRFESVRETSGDAVADDAAVAGEAHAHAVKIEWVGRGLGVEEFDVLRVGDFGAADAVVGRDATEDTVTGHVAGVAGIADGDEVNRDSTGAERQVNYDDNRQKEFHPPTSSLFHFHYSSGAKCVVFWRMSDFWTKTANSIF